MNLPSSTYETPKKIKNNDPIDRKDNWLISAIPKNRRHSYEIRPIIESVTDKNSFFEIGKKLGHILCFRFCKVRWLANSSFSKRSSSLRGWMDS